MAFSNKREKFVCLALTASLLMQANTVCLAARLDSGGNVIAIVTESVTETIPETTPTAENEIVYSLTETDSETAGNTDKESASENTYGHFTLQGPLGIAEPNGASEELPLLAQGPPLIGQPSLIGEQVSQASPYTFSGGASISPEEAMTKIDLLTRDILLKEIELQKFNLHYTSEVAKQGRWKGLRYGFLQELNAGTGLAGAIISVVNRGSYLNRPAGVKRYAQQSANYIPAIGSIVGATAALMEFGINGYHDVVARRHGFSPSAAMKHVSGIKTEIDTMMAERQALTKVEANAPELAGHVQVDEAEGKVLKDLRDQSIQEFERFHVGARRTIAYQQMQYFF